jgi:YafQ family addiction module toxin component
VFSSAILRERNRGATSETWIRSFSLRFRFWQRNKPLPEKNRDHALGGEWRDHRECHLKPDLLLIYRKPNAAVLQLVRLGSHSELFG